MVTLTDVTDSTFAGTTAGGGFSNFSKRGRSKFTIAGAGDFLLPSNFWLKSGTLELDYTGSGNANVNKIKDSGSFYMNNAVLRVKLATDADGTEQFGTLVFSPGSDYGGLSQIVIENAGTKSRTLKFANASAFTRASNNVYGGILRFSGVDGSSNRVLFANSAVATNGILGGFAVVKQGAAVDFAEYDHVPPGTVLA